MHQPRMEIIRLELQGQLGVEVEAVGLSGLLAVRLRRDGPACRPVTRVSWPFSGVK